MVFEFAGEWYAVDLDSTAGLVAEAGPRRLHHFTAEAPWVRMGPVVLWIDGPRESRARSSRGPMPIERRTEPVVRTRTDFVDPAPPPPATDAASLLVAFRRRSDDAIRLLDLAAADRIIIGGDPACDLIVPGDEAAMRAILFRVGSKWAVADLTRRTRDDAVPGHRRLSPGGRWDLGAVEATVLTAEPAIPRENTEAETSGLEGLDVPDLGSIFAGGSDDDGGGTPDQPRKP